MVDDAAEYDTSVADHQIELREHADLVDIGQGILRGDLDAYQAVLDQLSELTELTTLGEELTFSIVSDDVNVEDDSHPLAVTLSQNSPNPFNPVTAIPFSLAEPSDISLIVYNATGAQVAVLTEGAYPTGPHTVNWDASDHASGLYFYRLHAGGTAVTGKMMLVK